MTPALPRPAPPRPKQWPVDRVLHLAASAENGSEHPLAKAVLGFAAMHLDPALADPTEPGTPPDSPAYDSGGCPLSSWEECFGVSQYEQLRVMRM